VAKKIAINIFTLLIVVLFTGAWVLKLFGIQIPIVQLGGGAVVATVAWRIMNKTEDDSQSNPYRINTEEKGLAMAFFPLTLPMICGPGTITVAITLGANELNRNIWLLIMHYLGLSIGIAIMAATAFFCYHYAGYMTQRIGKNGTLVIMKLSAFISLCIGLGIMWKGVQGLIALYMASQGLA
jgi:multiple antibiotic resistance protein